jgi:hypothetical protein
MSTFGKKALIWWDYDVCKQEKPDLNRFNNSPENIQLSILEKYYPIGMECKVWRNMWNVEESKINYFIRNYEKLQAGYRLRLSTSGIVMSDTYHPMRVCPTDNWRTMLKRESKLDRILENKKIK